MIGERTAGVAIISGSRLYADAVEALLLAHPFHIVQSAPCFSALSEHAIPELILLMPPVEGGRDSVELLRTRFPSVPIVMVGVAEDESVPWLLAGVAGVVPQDSSAADLYRALEIAMVGGHYLSGRAAATLLDLVRVDHALETNGAKLTGREREIARFLAEGRRNKEIAAELHIAECTVKTHVRSLYQKIGARNRAEAAQRLLLRSPSG